MVNLRILRRSIKKNILFLCISLLISHFLLLTSSYASEPLGKRIETTEGMVVLISERHDLPIVKVNVIIKAGSILELEDRAGLANLTAELLTEGTRKRTSSQISDEIDFIGGSLESSGGDDYISVSLSVLKKDIDKGFDLLSDIILNPSFDQKEMERKKRLIKGAIKREEEDPESVAGKAFVKEVFGNHPYGKPVEGTDESIDRIDRQNIIEFHNANYLPNNTIMGIAGDVTVDEVMALIKKYFTGWEKKDRKYKKPPELQVIKGHKIFKIDRDLTQATIILGHRGISRDNPDFYAISVMNYILGGGGFASRLVQNIRDSKGLAYDVHSFFSAKKDIGDFRVGVQTRNEAAGVAINEIIKEIKRIREEGITEQELSDAKGYLTGSFSLRIDTNAKVASLLTAIEFYGLGLDYPEKYKDLINAITREDVIRVARKYLDPENFVLVVVAKQDKVQIKEVP
jgi:zinc protease